MRPLRAAWGCGRSPRVRGRRIRLRPDLRVCRKIPARAGTTRVGGQPGDQLGEDPRACGDDGCGCAARGCVGGRSPRVRGRRRLELWADDAGRKIPARAGTTRARRGGTARPREDPRACGDDVRQPPGHHPQQGRSPRVRGRRGPGPGAGFGSRKIPARAGTTGRGRGSSTCCTEDPRACGDDRARRGRCLRVRGRSPRVRGRRGFRPDQASVDAEDPRACGDDVVLMGVWPVIAGRSPRVRGRRTSAPTTSPSTRKIPARAGTTERAASTEMSWVEDPRACGDDRTAGTSHARAKGRSPRVRGQRRPRIARRRGVGKIPARAGTTDLPRPGHTANREDPRACGDDGGRMELLFTYYGRSPRVRGRRVVDQAVGRARGKIPARAGTTDQNDRRPGGSKEDPRACGDDDEELILYSAHEGRSPRVRGRHSVGSGTSTTARKIPARAGTTPRASVLRIWSREDSRACGDDRCARPPMTGMRGRSPRVRGRPPPAASSGHRGGEDPRACGDDR